MIKVLHTEWSDGWGGQEIRIISEMKAVRNLGIYVALACRDKSKIKEQALKNNFEVFVVPFKGNYHIPTIIKLIKLIKEHEFNIINTHSGKDSWTGGIAAKLAGAKFIRTRHLSNKINPSRFNFINELADFVMTTGESVRLNMIKNNRILPEKVLSVPTGIDSTLFNPINFNRDKERKRYGIDKGEVAIGIIAVLREFKRHEMFIDMAEKVSEIFPQCKFFIAGEGPRKGIIKSMIKEKDLKEKVILLGHISNPYNLLSALDISILTSDKNEGVPQSVIQALMMNKPVIATDVGSTKDLLKNNNFILLEPNNLPQLIKAVSLLINNKKLRENYSQKARASVVEIFSEAEMGNKVIDIYKTILGAQ